MSATVLPQREWGALEAAHEARVDALTAAHRARRADAASHPVEDFLFVYYNNSPARLRRWHPGARVVLGDASRMPRAGWTHYRTTDDGAVQLDVDSFVRARGAVLRFARDLLSRTASRAPQLRCFGLHEWAMVHQVTEDEVRHAGLPLRLGPAGTDEVVRSHQLRCTHFDAFRFFTDAARPLNALAPTRETQVDLEQPGCLHAGMDLYKWAFKLAPGIPSGLTLDCFELAREIRILDMRASPYDLRGLGHEAVPIETAEGKAAYVAAQRGFSERSTALRHRLVEAIDGLGAAAAP